MDGGLPVAGPAQIPLHHAGSEVPEFLSVFRALRRCSSNTAMHRGALRIARYMMVQTGRKCTAVSSHSWSSADQLECRNWSAAVTISHRYPCSPGRLAIRGLPEPGRQGRAGGRPTGSRMSRGRTRATYLRMVGQIPEPWSRMNRMEVCKREGDTAGRPPTHPSTGGSRIRANSQRRATTCRFPTLHVGGSLLAPCPCKPRFAGGEHGPLGAPGAPVAEDSPWRARCCVRHG